MHGSATLAPGAEFSFFSWVDACGRQGQAEGDEQDTIVSNELHGVLEEVASSAERGEQLCALLDVFVLCAPTEWSLCSSS